MLHELAIGRENRDGADQGFLASYFPDLLDQPMFHQPPNATKLDGNYRLPLGYQMDASYYCEYISHLFQGFFFFFFNNSHIVIIFIPYLNPCSIFGASDLKLRWTIPCGPNSVITFPSAPWLKPWYWWSWPVLPLGLSWHRQRLQTLG